MTYDTSIETVFNTDYDFNNIKVYKYYLRPHDVTIKTLNFFSKMRFTKNWTYDTLIKGIFNADNDFGQCLTLKGKFKAE